MTDISIAFLMAAVAVALTVLFLKYKSRSSEKRMTTMMQRLGLDPDIASQKNTEAVIREVRRRCQKCQSEGICERWLVGMETRDTDFCPNAQVFEELKRSEMIAEMPKSFSGERG